MNISALAPVFLFAHLAAAGIVNWPLDEAIQFVVKMNGDCPFGEVTPSGCGPRR
ncbi:hypothetical protein CP533_2398 [Ophiocordyceps camponoti-saundersi (nom. inval.)]|nr:hypothetical protein CP533_2398 [Ophiocordyceps camponoti-saundersi (nom. inval.)]